MYISGATASDMLNELVDTVIEVLMVTLLLFSDARLPVSSIIFHVSECRGAYDNTFHRRDEDS